MHDGTVLSSSCLIDSIVLHKVLTQSSSGTLFACGGLGSKALLSRRARFCFPFSCLMKCSVSALRGFTFASQAGNHWH